jgi:hypothetical protein
MEYNLVGTISKYIVHKLEQAYKHERAKPPPPPVVEWLEQLVLFTMVYGTVVIGFYYFRDRIDKVIVITWWIGIAGWFVALPSLFIIIEWCREFSLESEWTYRRTLVLPLFLLLRLPLPGRKIRLDQYRAFKQVVNDEINYKLSGSTDRFEKTRTSKKSIQEKMKDTFKWSLPHG